MTRLIRLRRWRRGLHGRWSSRRLRCGADHQLSRFLPAVYRRRQVAARPRGMDELVRGFLGGMMWIFAARTGDQYWRERAERYSLLIEERQHDTSVHDLGFVFWSTWKRWFDQTGDEAIEGRVIQAGRTMGLRFNEVEST